MRRANLFSLASVFGLFACASLVCGDALADRVARLHAGGGGGEGDKLALDRATEIAVHALGHTTATDAEVLQGEGAAGGLLGTSAGLVVVGKTSGSDWVIVAKVVVPRTATAGPRVEIEACQVSSGRVETVARDFPAQGDDAALVREMLAVLLRPQGVGDDPLPWEKAGPTDGVSPGSSPSGEGAAAPATARAPATYAIGGRFAAGIGGGALDLASRGEGAIGSRLAGAWSVTLLYTAWQPSKTGPAVDVLARGGGVFGPGPAARATLGARVMLPLTSFFAAGGGGMIGVFVPTGDRAGDHPTRPVFGLAGTTSFTLFSRVQLDLDLLTVQVLPAKEGTLVLLGGEASILARF